MKGFVIKHGDVYDRNTGREITGLLTSRRLTYGSILNWHKIKPAIISCLESRLRLLISARLIDVYAMASFTGCHGM